jgi:hypothetical protein
MKKVILILFAVLLSFQYLTAQKKQTNDTLLNKNTIYASVGWLVLYGTVNLSYERNLFQPNRKLIKYVNLKASYGKFATWGIAGDVYMLNAVFLTGVKKNHLEAIAGLSIFFDREGYDIGVSNANYPYPGYEPEPSKADYTDFLPVLGFGYRYQKPGGRFIFRTGLNFPEMIYLSFGYAF